MPAAMASWVVISKVSKRSSGMPNSLTRSNSPRWPDSLSVCSRSSIVCITAPASLLTRRVIRFFSMDWRVSGGSRSIRISPFNNAWTLPSSKTRRPRPGNPSPAPLMTTDPVSGCQPGAIGRVAAACFCKRVSRSSIVGAAAERGSAPEAYNAHSASLNETTLPFLG